METVDLEIPIFSIENYVDLPMFDVYEVGFSVDSLIDHPVTVDSSS